ncbi:MAG TPA: O-antigen ligase family protein, partial [Gemmatimonadaceae bacterium]|nr:O-antigen ligase family protein [Gemmatimonadaceae bacterium]
MSARSVAATGAIGLLIGNIGRIPSSALGGRTAPLVANDLVVAAVWAVLLLALASGWVRVAVDDVMAAAGGFITAAALSTALAFYRYKLGIVDGAGVLGFLARWIAYFGWYPFVVWCLTAEESRRTWRDVEMAILAFALFGILQSAFLPGFAQLLQDGGDLPTWDIQGRRLVSTLLDPNFAGIVIVIGLLFRLARAAEGIRESVAAMVVLGAAVLLTVSRSALIGLAVGVTVIAVVRGFQRRLLVMLAGAAVLAVPFLPLLASFAAGFNKLRYDMSAAQRLVPWTRAIRLMIEHPWLGVGFNAIRQAQESHQWRSVGGADVSLDGGLLFVGAMTGLVGVFLYLFMVSRMWRGARRVWREPTASPDERAHATATAAATAAVIAHSFFVNSLLLTFVMQIVWIMWGRLAHIRATRRARLGLVAAIPLLAAMASCDPCAGTASCSTSPQVALSGTIVDHATGAGVGGARVDVHLTAASGATASGSAVSASDGVWLVTIGTANTQTEQAQITVTASSRPSYTVSGLAITPSTQSGAATLLGTWTDVPSARYLATLVVGGTPLVDAQVHFTPNAGQGLTSAQTDAVTNGAGIFELDFAGQTLATIVGVLTVTHPSLSQPAVLFGYQIPLDYHFGIPASRATVPIGAQLSYGGEVVFRGTGEKVANVGVDFLRTGGIATTPNEVSATTSSSG